MKKIIFVGIVMFLLMISMAFAYPMLHYNKNKVNITRFKEVMYQIPEEYFDGVSFISVKDIQHPSKPRTGQIYCRKYRCKISIYQFPVLTDYGLYNLLLHELGHKYEFRAWVKHNIGWLVGSEAYAENWRIDHGGDKNLNLSST